MSPGLWLALVGTVGGAVLVTSMGDDEGERAVEEGGGNELRVENRHGRASANRGMSSGSRREITRRAKVIFVDNPDDFMFFGDQVEGKSEEAQRMFDSWSKTRSLRESLREEGLGPNHPQITSLGDREVLVGNRLNQRLRNESQ